MIVFKDTKSFLGGIDSLDGILRNGTVVNRNEVYVLEEDSPLAKKIIAYFPDFEFVLDDGGNLSDVAAVPHVATEAENRGRYENLVVEKIRETYSQNDENKILREALASGTFNDFDIYNSYVEQCKVWAKKEVYGEELV